MKQCSACETTKPLSEFWKNKRAKDGILQKCKDCAKPSGYQKFCTHIKYHYGLTPSMWWARLKEQSGRCGICNDPMDDPVVDHCHKEGHIRGLLCRQCNILLGAGRDSPVILRKAINFLEETK